MAQRRDVPNQEFKLRLLASQIRTVSRSVIVLRKIKILKFKGLTEIRLKTFLHFIHTLRIGRTLFALSPPACFARHDGGEGWWLGADVRPDIRNTMSGQARWTRRSRRERPFTAFGKGRGRTVRRKLPVTPGPDHSRSGLGKTWPARPEDRRPRKCGRQRYPYQRPTRICVCSPGQDKTCHGCIAPRERRSAS